MSKQVFTLAIATASALAFATTVPAFPEASKTVRSASVSYADLDLSNANGARAMVGRIRATARRLCGPEPTTAWWSDYKDYRECLAKGESGAIRRLNAPLVTAFYDGRGADVILAQANDH